MGVPSLIAFLPVLASILALFPVFLLSMLEGSSLLSFDSPSILATLTRHRRPWTRFYGGALIVGVLLILSDSPRWFGAPLVVHASIIAALFSFSAMIYFRLLGRLAWWLQDLTSITVQPKPRDA